jgi:hypothetical protein
MKKLMAIVGAGLVLVFLAYYAWPIGAIMRLASALESGDGAAIAARVDIDHMRRALAREVGRAYLDQSGQREFAPGERDAAIGKAGAQAKPVIDELITQEHLAAFLKSGRIERAGAPPLALGSSLSTFASLAKRGFLPVLFATDPDGLTRFVVIVDAPGEPTLRYGLLFHLSGITWRLSELDLPRGMRLQLAAEVAARAKQ